MNGKERVVAALAGEPVDRLPCLPILHSGLPPIFDVSLGAFFSDAEVMAQTIIEGYRTFGYDGVQLSLGVTGEAEALGAVVEQPENAAPLLRSQLIPDFENLGGLDRLRERDPTQGGRMPLYYDAVHHVTDAIGDEAFVLAMLRGPLLAASQLCGVETLLIGLITHPEAVARVLELTSDVVLHLGRWLVNSGAHGLILGEATCSPNFISPQLYREVVQPRHAKLVKELRAAGWNQVGLHICGDTAPIFDDIIRTGVTFMDVDYQVPAQQAMALARQRIALRGNVDPSTVFRFGTAQTVAQATQNLCAAVHAHPGWILSSGCDIPPGTQATNIHAFVTARDDYASASTLEIRRR